MPANPTAKSQQPIAFLADSRLEIALTALTFVTMIAGWIVARQADAFTPTAVVCYVIAYVAGGVYGLTGAIASLRHGVIDIDLLMVLAALGAAYVGAPFEGAMLLFLFSLSNTLQHYAIGRSRNAIRALMKLRPQQARVYRNGTLRLEPIDAIAVDDVIVVHPGDVLPLDGIVMQGEAAVDQASLTGESALVHKKPGDAVFAGTINENGALDIRVTKTAADSTIAKLIALVEEAQGEKAHTQRFIDGAEQRYAVAVIIGTLLAIAVPIYLLGETFDTAFYRAMTLMVAASPCAIVISTPATILSAIANAARNGVLFKGGTYLERVATIRAIAFDKTGTLTLGQRTLTQVAVLPESGMSENEVLALAAGVQAHSEHSLALAITGAAQERNLNIKEATHFEAFPGRGVAGTVGDQTIHIGNLAFVAGFAPTNLSAATTRTNALTAEGQTCIAVMAMPSDGSPHLLGILAFADTLRPEAASALADLKAQGIEHIVMITGDNATVAQQMADAAGVDAVYADQLPEDKMRLLRTLEQQYGSVAMVGDGINDAPALAAATVGIAMGAAGTDVALETADVVLMSDDLARLPYVIALSRQTRRTIVANLAFAFAMIVVMVIAILTVDLPLPLAVIGHEGSTVLVSLNGLRLLGFRGS